MKRTILPIPRGAAGSQRRVEQGAGASAGRLLRFEVGGETFAIPVGFLREVIFAEAVSSSSGRMERECEIVMQRGAPLPAVDLRAVFGYGAGRRAADSRILVGEGDGRRLGLVVDRVGDVAEATPQSILSFPEGASALPAGCFRGVWCREEGVALILDPVGLAGLECVRHAEAASVAPKSGRVGGAP